MTAAIAAFVRQNALVFIKIKKLYSQLGVWFAFLDISCSLKINFGERNIILLKCLLWIFCLFFSACLSCFSFNSPGFHVWFWGFFCLLGFGVFFPLFFLFIESTEENDGGKLLYDIESLELCINKPFTK